ncbi:MAG: ABC transporter ATP-binding protein [Corynebacterium sp.]|nr:ABC transporter ATP-binding protein [Corynebacterium sp.]
MASVLSLLAAGVTLLQPHLVGSVMSNISTGAYTRPLVLLIGLIMVESILTGAHMYATAVAADRCVLYIRRALTRHLIALPMSEYDRKESGQFVTRLTADTSIVSTSFSTALVAAIGGVTVIVGATVYMALLDVYLFGVVILVVLVALLAITIASTRIEFLSEKVQDHLSHFGSEFQTLLSAIRTIKSFGAERKIQRILNHEITQGYQARRKMSLVEACLSPLASVTAYIAMIAVLMVGAMRVSSGALNMEGLITFATALFLVVAPLTHIAESITAFREARGALRRINNLLELPQEDVLDDSPAPATANVPAALPVSFYDVNYRDVLAGVSFSIKPGEKVALMGESGSGKTSILSLIQRFYEIDSGHILINNHDIKDLRLAELRSLIAYVEQEPTLLPGTLKDNLLVGSNDDAEDEQLINLLAAVGLTAFASTTGLATVVGRANSGVSGGERQRIAIARAILRQAPIVLVDEPTSALDSESGNLAIDYLLQTPATVLFSTHDLNVAQKADRILQVQGGGVTEVVATSPQD